MALFHCNFYSSTLYMNTDLYIIIPTMNSDELLNKKRFDYFQPGAKYQTLYLLHGAYGDYSDWIRLTSIEKYAQEKKVAVIMPSAANSFYQNMAHGERFFDYMNEELPKFVTAMFPLSDKREDTYVAGLSMGGYGAFKLALSNPDRFSCAASLSGTLDIESALSGPIAEHHTFTISDILDPVDKIEGSDADLFALAKKRLSQGVELPRFFQSIGTEDFLYDANVSAKKKFEELGLNLTYEEHPGIHDWNYWDANIQRVLNWLPLKNDLVFP
jgi:S-formylglutathione hydrolase FrmB